MNDISESDLPALCAAVGFMTINWSLMERQMDNIIQFCFATLGGIPGHDRKPSAFREKADKRGQTTFTCLRRLIVPNHDIGLRPVKTCPGKRMEWPSTEACRRSRMDACSQGTNVEMSEFIGLQANFPAQESSTITLRSCCQISVVSS